MTDLRKAAEMALEALEGSPELLVDWLDKLREVREALRQALAQPVDLAKVGEVGVWGEK